MKLIGLILNSLLKSYNNEECDNLTEEEKEEIINDLSKLKDKIELKQDEVLTTEQTSLYLNVTRQTIHNYVKQGILHPSKQLGGVLLFKKRELNEVINNSISK